MLKYSRRSQRWLGRLGNEGILLHVGVCMGGCVFLGTWLQLQGLRGVGRGSSTCGTSGFTTDAAEKETKDMQVHVHIHMIDYNHAHVLTSS